MPKKKKTKESSVPELKIDYRYTPKPYFTAPTSLQNGTVGPSSRPAQVRASPNTRSAWQSARAPTTSAASNTNSHSGSTNIHASKPYSSKPTSTRSSHSQPPKATGSKPPSDGSTAELTSKQKKAITRSFLEMFGNRIEHDVIELVLMEVNFSENQALDTLSQLSESHGHQIRQAALSAGLLGAITPDHSLTPTAPTLSYCSSMTSLDEFGIQQEQTRENLAQVADVLLQSEDINDLDRQKKARSRGTTPRSAYRNGSFLLKNISLGSTESLESNRSHANNGGFHSHYSTLTPKKSNALTTDKTVSLTDISTADDNLFIDTSGSRPASAYTTLTRSDPGSEFTNRLIPLEHGDIVIERPANRIEISSQQTDTQTEGRLNGHDSIHALSEEMNKLIVRLDDDQVVDKTLIDSFNADRTDEMVVSSDSGGIQITVSEQPQTSEVETASSMVGAWNGKTKNPALYNSGGMLSRGPVVPTPLVSVRPKHLPDMSAYNEHVNKLKTQLVQANGNVMVIMRGLPGSGKSTLARLLCDDTRGVVLSSDDYFINNKGEYIWDKNKLEQAHQYSQNKAGQLCKDGVSPVIIDNTNTMIWEMLPYAKISVKCNYRIIVIEPLTPWREKLSELAKRNKHKVPVDSIKNMLDRYEHDITSEQLLNTVNKNTLREQLQTSKNTAREQLLNTNLTQTPSSSTSSMVSRISDTTATTDNQSEPSSVKLSRKKVVSKTIKRNRQTDNIIKIKDKSVEKVMSTSMTDKNSEQTEIMYPSTSHITRKPSIKITNEPPQITKEISIKDTPTNHSTSTAKSTNQNVQASLSTSKTTPSGLSTNHSAPSAASTNSKISAATLSDVKAPVDTKTTQKVVDGALASLTTATSTKYIAGSQTLTRETKATSPVNKTTPLTNKTTAPVPSMNESVGTDVTKNAGITELAKPQVKNTSTKVDKTVITPLHVSTSQSSNELSSFTLPSKIKHKKTSTAPRSTSLDVLSQVDPDTKTKWLENDWKIPDYPKKVLSDIEEPLMKPSLIKTSDKYTLTDPSDYALAYKAMQLKSPLPQGWIMLTGVTKEPFKQKQNQEKTNQTTLSHDKSVMADMDAEELNSDTTDEINNSDKISKLQSCFPQLSTKDISETLDLCNGDEQWATNVLLDSNTMSLTKPSSSTTSKLSELTMTTKQRKRRKNSTTYKIRRAFSFPDARKMNYLKDKIKGKTSHSQLKRRAVPNEEMTDLIMETNVIEQLDQMLNGTEQPITDLIPESEKLHSISLPMSICKELYKYCVNSVISSAQSNLGAISISTNNAVSASSPVKTVRKNHLINKQKRLLQGNTTPSTIKSNKVNNFSQDEALARRLQAEEYLPNKQVEVTPHTGDEIPSLNDIMDEQLAEEICIKSLTDPANNSAEPIGAKIKRQQLYEMFPSTDRKFIDETFTTCGYNFEQTVDFLSQNYNLDIQNPEINKVIKNTSVEKETDWSDVDELEPPLNVEATSITYSECRSKAEYHKKKRKEAQDMVTSAREKKQYHLIQHYTEEAEEQRKKMVNANFAAAAAIFQNQNTHRDNNEIDLHGLHPQEAVIFINELIQQMRSKSSGRTRLRLITGWGKNSTAGTSMVKKAVTDFLTQKNIQYLEENRGMLRLTI